MHRVDVGIADPSLPQKPLHFPKWVVDACGADVGAEGGGGGGRGGWSQSGWK